MRGSPRREREGGCFPLRVGPDGVETFVELDDAGRVEYIRRGPIGDPIMMATYSYYADGLVHSVSYGNGTSIWYEYDAARRLTWIRHEGPLGHVLLRLNYEYTDRDEVARVWEMGFDNVTFTYDNRGRLVHERRSVAPVEGGSEGPTYDLSYQYDQGGNRTLKIDAENNRTVVYHYDIDEPSVYGSANNRLMCYETFDTSGRSSPLGKGGYRGVLPLGNAASEGGDRLESRSHRNLLSTTWYYYNESGNPTRIVTNEADTDHYTATRFKYASNQTAVTYIAGEEWDWDGDPWSEPTDYGVTYAREFRYDQARARYLNRELDPTKLMLGQHEALSETWSDYDGDEIYGDFAVSASRQDAATVTNLRSFEPGMAKVDPWTTGGAASTSYYHGDIIDTTRLMSDPGGTGISRVAYAGFTERFDGASQPLQHRRAPQHRES